MGLILEFSLHLFTAHSELGAEVAAVVSSILRVWNHLQQPLCIVRHSNEKQQGWGWV